MNAMNEPGLKIKEPYKRLADINRAITTSLNFDKVLELIVENAAQLVRARVSLLLLADGDGLLRIRAATGANPTLMKSFVSRMEEDVIRKLHKSLGVKPDESIVSVPVIAKNSLDGLLVIIRDLPVNEEEQWQLSALADQAAIALANARLYEMELAEGRRERDQTLEALRESNDKIKRILESITDLFYSLDRDWRFVELNRQTEILFRRGRDELVGQVIWEVYPHAVDSPLYPNLHKAMEEMKPVHFELASKIVPGVWFEAHAYPSEEGVTVYLRDITERRKSEVINQRMGAIVESSDDAIISKDLNGVISSWNKGAERIFGYTAEEAIGQPVTILIPPDHLDEEPAILDRIRSGRRVEHYQTIRRHKNGRLLDISITVSPVKDAEGKIVGASKIARDISEQKRREEKIRFQAHLLDAVEQAVIATNLEGKIIYWNSFAEWLFGWTTEEAIGTNVMDLTPALSERNLAAEILTMVRSGESWSGEFLARKKDGSEFPLLVTDSPIFEEGRLIGIIGVSVDISERKRAEEERTRLLESEREARREAEKANRLKDEFLATLSHELRNPLNVILGYAEVLLRSDEAKQSEFVKRAGETLKRNALSQSQLVRDLLDLSRLHMGKLSLNREMVSLTKVISDAVETVTAEAAAKEISINVETTEEVLFVDADPLRMEQVIWNLLNNAVKFTPPRGSVTVRLASQDEHAVLQVEDTGQGIDAEFLPQVFQMFRQADATSSRRHGGLGIGLALVEQLIQQHDGEVGVFSEGLGRGALFTIKLPLKRETKKSLRPEPEVNTGVLSHLRILVVDDSSDTIDMLKSLFEMDGAIVNTARSGAEALEIIKRETLDVVLSDISMPVMDGFELLRRMRALPKGRQVPVLALTGFGREADIERAKAEGFFSHVTKPVDVGSLVRILRELPVRNKTDVNGKAESYAETSM